MDVSVIIVNYNSYQYLIDCVESIYRNVVGLDYEVIIVDNNTLSFDMIRNINCKYPKVNLILSDKNLGFGGANNVGASHAKGKYLFFLNPDTILVNNAVLILSSFLKEHSDVALCGGTLLDQNGRNQNSYGNEVFPFWRELKSVIRILPTLNRNSISQDECFQCQIISGADMMIRKSDFDVIGGFDTRFFMYYEEADISMRLQKIGKKICYIKQSEIIHLEGKSECEHNIYNQVTRIYYVISQLRFLQKYNRFYFYIFYTAHFMKSLLANIRYSHQVGDRVQYWRSYLKSLYSI